MKNPPSRSVILTLLAVLLFAATTESATRTWTYTLPDGGPNQFVADGAGGIAILFSATSSTFVIWLDGRGRENYKRAYPNPGPAVPNAIVGVSRHGLVYEMGAAGWIAVDKRGQESAVAGAFVMDSPAARSRYTDDSGFFVFEQPNQMIRYEY